MSTTADHTARRTEHAHSASTRHPFTETPSILAVMALMAVLAIAGVAMASPVTTALAGLSTVIAAFCAAYSLTYDAA